LGWRRPTVAAVVCLAVAGCGEGPGMKVDWDLPATRWTR